MGTVREDYSTDGNAWSRSLHRHKFLAAEAVRSSVGYPRFHFSALVNWHRRAAGTGDAFRVLANQFKMPVLMHRRDAKHPQVRVAQVPYENPIARPLLVEFGLEAIHFPGHTSGHIALYGAEKGGLLFAGDAPVGTTAGQAASGIERLIRPPGRAVDRQ